MSETPLLEVRGLAMHFPISEGIVMSRKIGEVKAVDGVDFSIARGETLGLVGESGCGKTTMGRCILRLEKPTEGEILYDGVDIAKLGRRQLVALRRRIQVIFQDPMTSLNPVFKIGYQVAEAIRIHRKVSKKEARKLAGDMLELVSIPDPIKRLDDYPHQLSGGMRQRVMIAMALSCDPELLIADEPTTALDVTIQAQIMELLASLQKRLGLAILLITHDLGVVAEFCERIIVMYTGRIVEESPVRELFANPAHPYTRGLLKSLPSVAGTEARLPTIKGMVPPLTALPSGCKFNPRCPDVMPICLGNEPARIIVGEGHDARCYLHGDLADPERIGQ